MLFENTNMLMQQPSPISMANHIGGVYESSQQIDLISELSTPSTHLGSQERKTAAPDNTQYREKRFHSAEDMDEVIQALSGLSLERDFWFQTAASVKSDCPAERLEGTKRFRMMLSVSGEIPIQDVIDTGVVPQLVEFVSCESNPVLQFEAAWALTNIASGTGSQTQVIVDAGALPNFMALLKNPREDIREQGMWGLGNIAGDRPEFRDKILSYEMSVDHFIDSCNKSRRPSTIRTGVWALSNLCRGKPRPQFHLVAVAIPFLASVVTTCNDDDTLSDACWALDGLSEYTEGINAFISNGLVGPLVQLLSHKQLIVQRPALRLIGQIAAGTAEQTQEIISHGVISALSELLDSPRKSIRKDACWTLSNIAAGSSSQLEDLLKSGVIPKLVTVFQNDCEIDVKKEAAWAICNACTAERPEQLQYLISCSCVKPVCEMLTIDDPKILEVSLEALENILQFGERLTTMATNSLSFESRGEPSCNNICVHLVGSYDGFSHLTHLHKVAQGLGSYTVWEKSGLLLRAWGTALQSASNAYSDIPVFP